MRRPAVLLGIQIVVVAAILGCALALATLHPWRLDLTPERRFTLSPHTHEVLRRLAGGVQVTFFYSSQEPALRREAADLLALYAEADRRIAVRLLDLDRNPVVAKRLGVAAFNTAVVQAGDRVARVPVVAEETVTAALLDVAGTPPVATYFVTGHGERDPRDADERLGASETARALAAEGFRIHVLAGAAVVPADAGLVVLAGPRRDLRAPEVDALERWVRGGGHLLVLADPGAPPSVARLLARFGVELADDLVVDEQGRLFGTDGLSARVAYLNQALVPDASDVQALLPGAQTMRLADVPEVESDYLAMTAETSWADVDRRGESGEVPAYREGRDRRGPLPVAAWARVGAGERAGRVVVVGDADFATNLHVNVLGNRDLLLAAAGLVARADPLAAARPAAPPGGTFSPLTLTVPEERAIFWGAVVAPAGLLAATALLVARRRRTARTA
ncbi:MAG TPA: GldG family protein [Candidatus Binatia bacterium]|nr:GldG family protein [Candidatus Binatia bacterium]